MVTDRQANFLYLADSLPKKYPDFYFNLRAILIDRKIDFALLPGTKDVWAVDYMPVQVTGDSFIKFTYNPDYLRNSAKWRKTISDVDFICNSIGIPRHNTDIILDGGNLVRTTEKAIICDKVFCENSTMGEKEIIRQLKELLQIEELIVIPSDPDDFTGHADGLVRFYDDDTVLVNDYSDENESFKMNLESVLRRSGFEIIKVPYNPYDNNSIHQANGTYLNYLEMENLLILPVFQIKEDEEVTRLFEQLYKKEHIFAIDCNEIADQGGILNCISWNIQVS